MRFNSARRIGYPFSYLSTILNNDPFTPLALCAQNESAEILSRRAIKSRIREGFFSSIRERPRRESDPCHSLNGDNRCVAPNIYHLYEEVSPYSD